MEVLILDNNFDSITVIDTFESLLWTERYCGQGNFELYTPVNDNILNLVKLLDEKRSQRIDYYAWTKDSEMVMVIETSQIETDVERGSYVIISGYSLESLLNRRIIWNQTTFNNKPVQDAIKILLDQNAISPSDISRKIPDLIFEYSSDSKISGLRLSAQYTGNNLYDTLVEICDLFGIGFKIILRDDKKLVFKLYNGVDRSYGQTDVSFVIFSPKFDNMISSNYLDSITTLKNTALVAGEGEGNNRKKLGVGVDGIIFSGLSRREMYVDARDLQAEDEEGQPIPEAEYDKQLTDRALEKLSENKYTRTFEGQVEATQRPKYNEDFFKGDIVQIENEYEMVAKVRVVEVIRAQDTTGFNVYPTFSIIE